MSKEEVLGAFYGSLSFTRAAGGWKTAFDPERLRGVKLTHDLVDAATGAVVAKIGDKMTPRLGRKLKDEGLSEVLVTAEEMKGRYTAGDIINEATGEVRHEAGDEITEAMLNDIDDLGITRSRRWRSTTSLSAPTCATR
jgi:DNA-directed RNA polymerase subunit beta